MSINPRSDIVSEQYSKWVYPEPINNLPQWLANNWQWFDPSHAHRLFWPDRDYKPDMDILIAGCGTNQAAVFAYTNPGARVVAVDVSEPSLQHHRRLKQTYGLKNLELHLLPIEEVGSLQQDFDLIVSTGVLHHMADPQVGLQALASCLRPEGVAALMLYARYGRIGVEMLQELFRQMGLRQDEASLGIVKEVIASLGKDHPLQSYLAIAPDLQYDAGIVDTFLHGRDRSYTVADCLELVDSARLQFQDWFMKVPYCPPVYSSSAFETALAAEPEATQWAAMEKIHHRNGCHFFTACHPGRPTQTFRIDFKTPQAWHYVPDFRYRCGLQGQEIFRPGWRLGLDESQLALVRLIDGKKTIQEIVQQSSQDQDGLNPSGPDTQSASLAVFRSLWQGDFLAMGIRPA